MQPKGDKGKIPSSTQIHTSLMASQASTGAPPPAHTTPQMLIGNLPWGLGQTRANIQF